MFELNRVVEARLGGLALIARWFIRLVQLKADVFQVLLSRLELAAMPLCIIEACLEEEKS